MLLHCVEAARQKEEIKKCLTTVKQVFLLTASFQRLHVIFYTHSTMIHTEQCVHVTFQPGYT